MNLNEYLLKLFDLEKDAKVVFNTNDYTEVEMRLFCLENALTVRDIFRTIVESLNFFKSINPVFSWEVVYHKSHYKKFRYYEFRPIKS